MKKPFIYLLFLVVPIFFQACTGCDDEDYPTVSKENIQHGNTTPPVNDPVVDHTSSGSKQVIKMRKENGVYKIKAKIDGQELDFIFDTGAGMISMSNVEATLLFKEGRITKDDFVGKGNFQDATGDISEGVIINLKEVTIGDKTVYNIQASVTDNSNAPVLFGESALEKFGKITIDYENLEITFQ